MDEKSGGELGVEIFEGNWLEKEIKIGKKSQVKIITLVLLLALISASSLVIASNLLNETANQSITSLEILPNFSLNQTVESSNATLIENQTNVTETNESQSNETLAEIPVIPEDEIRISLEYPEKVNRGEDFKIKARLENLASISLKIVEIDWKLPKGFEILSRNDDCKILNQNSACNSEILVHSSLSTELGLNQIKVVVKYE